MTYSIYTLTCPVDNNVKYVGITSNLNVRLYQHFKTPSPSTYKWIETLKNNNLKPVIEEIESVNYMDIETEQYWIQQFKAWGHPLLNKIKHKRVILRKNKSKKRISKYAKEKGITVQAVYAQIKRGDVRFRIIDGVKFILEK